ncbi:hypothetical protein HAX54_004866 [Datura stramonium]|uniref:Uncharacterized protein n=1 Tax=Datura stramonium TaxID=4076 RepID=A0ABS8TA38_DATST|nr:hypothetical protein [Datura stramonium]
MKGSSFNSSKTKIENTWAGISCCNQRILAWAFANSEANFAKSGTIKSFALSFTCASMPSIQAWRLSYGYGAVDDVSVDSIPCITAFAPDVDGVDVGSGATMKATSTLFLDQM